MTSIRPAIRWAAGLALVVTALAPIRASADCSCLRLRTFTAEERQRFESQNGLEWWRTLGLVPGPAQPDDWVERPSGDSSIRIYAPQQFWDLRACVTSTGTIR